MVRLKKRYGVRSIYIIFLLCCSVSVGLFLYRIVKRMDVTPMSDGQIISSAKSYQFGTVYDRNGSLIVKGDQGGVKWESEITRQAFESTLGIDVESSLNSRSTVCGNCPWLFGTEDKRFSVYHLLHPGSTRKGGGVQVTIDKELQEYVSTFFQNQSYQNAYAVISNYKTGEILAVYGDALKQEMHPGSTLKPILAAAAMTIDEKNRDYTYECTDANHNFKTNDGTFRINCAGNEAHGQMNMEDALAYSCNGYFISLLQKINRSDMVEELKKWGFDSCVSYPQFIYWDHTFLGKGEEEYDYLLAAIGQANAYITPAGLNFITNALLNHGVLKTPVWFTEKQSSEKEEWEKVNNMVEDRSVCSEEAADSVIQMMKAVTEKGTGVSFYLPDFAAKTGTAQKSSQTGETSDLYTVWTTGGIVNDETPYSITVCLDDVSGEVTSAVAGTMAKEILVYVMEGENNVRGI